LSIQLYVKQTEVENEHKIDKIITELKTEQKLYNNSLDSLFEMLNEFDIK